MISNILKENEVTTSRNLPEFAAEKVRQTLTKKKKSVITAGHWSEVPTQKLLKTKQKFYQIDREVG